MKIKDNSYSQAEIDYLAKLDSRKSSGLYADTVETVEDWKSARGGFQPSYSGWLSKDDAETYDCPNSFSFDR